MTVATMNISDDPKDTINRPKTQLNKAFIALAKLSFVHSHPLECLIFPYR